MHGVPHGPAGVPGALGETIGRVSLLALLEEAVIASDHAEKLLTTAEDGSPPTAADARLALHLRIRFAELQRWVDDLELSGRDAEVRDEAARLLSFYLHLLTHAFDRRIAEAGRDRLAIRSSGPLTGAPCARLTLLRERVSSWVR